MAEMASGSRRSACWRCVYHWDRDGLVFAPTPEVAGAAAAAPSPVERWRWPRPADPSGTARRRGARGGRPPTRTRCVRRAERARRNVAACEWAPEPPRRRRRTRRRIAAGSSAPSVVGQHRGRPPRGTAPGRRASGGAAPPPPGGIDGERRAAQVVAEGHAAARATSPASARYQRGTPTPRTGSNRSGIDSGAHASRSRTPRASSSRPAAGEDRASVPGSSPPSWSSISVT